MKLSEIIAAGGYVDEKGWVINPDCDKNIVYIMTIDRDIVIPPGMDIKDQKILALEKRVQDLEEEKTHLVLKSLSYE